MPMTLERSPDTDAVVRVLRACNDEIAYEQIALRSGLTLARSKQVLRSARRVIEKDGILFGVIRGQGLRLLADKDKTKLPEPWKKHVARGSRRVQSKLDTIANFGGLTKAEQYSVTTNRTILNVIEQQAKVKPEEPSKRKVADLPIADVTRLIVKK